MAGAQKLADAELRIMSADGFLPGRQRQDFSAASDWCCLTGSRTNFRRLEPTANLPDSRPEIPHWCRARESIPNGAA